MPIIIKIILSVVPMRSLALRGPADKSYKCMTRQNSQTSPGYFCYTPQTFARYNFSPLHLYLLYFPSYFTRAFQAERTTAANDQLHREPLQTVMERNFSSFFKTFCRQVVLNSLLGQEETNSEFSVKLTLEMMINHSSEKELGIAIRKLIMEICLQYRQFFIEGPNRARQWEQAQPIIKEMRNNIDRLVREAEKNPTNMLETQFFTAVNGDPKLLTIFIRRNFERISNIHVIRRDKRKQMLDTLQEQLGSRFSINILWLKDVRGELEKAQVQMLSNTFDKEAILSALPTYLKNIYVLDIETSLSLAKAVIKLFSEFLRDAKRPYPHLKPSSLFINQKSLKPVFEQAELIMDALGVSGNTNTVEQDIALAATPVPFEYEKCYLEYHEEVEWTMVKKYYYPKRRQQNEGEESKTQQLIKVDGRQISERALLEHIHVWRLLCVLYTILNSQTANPAQLAFKVYTDAYGSAPFYRNKYLNALQKIDISLSNGEIGLRELLNVSTIRPQQGNNTQFGFTMAELCEEFEVCNEEDSILNDLRCQSTYGELFLRIRFVHELVGMLSNEKYFRRLANPKKYIIIYLVQASQSFFETALFTNIEILCPGSRKQLTHRNPINQGISLAAERKKRRLLLITVKGKLKEYEKRKDGHSAYISTQQTVIKTIKAISQNLEKIAKFQAQLNQHEILMTLKPNQITVQKQNAKIVALVKKQSLLSFNECITALDRFTKSEITGKIKDLLEFHKMVDLSENQGVRKQAATLLNRRLKLMIQAYTRIRHDNWRAFETLIEPALIRSSKHVMRLIQRISADDMETINEHLSFAERSILEFKVQQQSFLERKF